MKCQNLRRKWSDFIATPDTSNPDFLQAPLSLPPLPQAFISRREKNEFHFPNAGIAGAERN